MDDHNKETKMTTPSAAEQPCKVGDPVDVLYHGSAIIGSDIGPLLVRVDAGRIVESWPAPAPKPKRGDSKGGAMDGI